MSSNEAIIKHNEGYSIGHMIGTSHGREDAEGNFIDSYVRNTFDIRRVNDPYDVGAAIGYFKGYDDGYWTVFNEMYPRLPAGSMWDRTTWQKTR